MSETGEFDRDGGRSVPEREGPSLRENNTMEQTIMLERNSDQSADAHRRRLDRVSFMTGLSGLYEAVLSEPTPEHMLKLVEAIKQKEAGP